MIGMAIELARTLSRALTPKAWLWLTVVAAVVVLGVWLFLAGRRDGREGAEARTAEASAQAERVNAGAIARAGDEHVNDERAIGAREKERNDAVVSIPDTRPSDGRVALSCERLRQQGDDPTRVPACRGLGGRGQAPAGSGRPGQ